MSAPTSRPLPLLLIPVALMWSSAVAGCYRQGRCEAVPGRDHHYTATSQPLPPGGDWLWVEGCWYWNGDDWSWLERQWMPPGSRVDYVGTMDDRQNYCVFSPTQDYGVPALVQWPPDAYVDNRSVQEIVIHESWFGGYRGVSSAVHVRDHRKNHSGRRNHRVPIRRHHQVPTHPEPERPSLGDSDVGAPPIGPVYVPPVERPSPRPPAPDVGPAEKPPDFVRHPPRPPIYVSPSGPTGPSAPPSVPVAPQPSTSPPGPAAPPPPAAAAPSRPTAPAPRPAEPPPPRPAAPTPRPAAPAPRPAQPPATAPARPSAPRQAPAAPSRPARAID